MNIQSRWKVVFGLTLFGFMAKQKLSRENSPAQISISETITNNSTGSASIPRPLPDDLVTPILPARLVIKPFGWNGQWHPLHHSGLANYTSKFILEIAPRNYRPKPGRLNLRFDVVEPFTVPLNYATARSPEDLKAIVKKQETNWYHTLTLCPYTASWINNLVGEQARQHVFYPVDVSTTTDFNGNREFDVMLASSKLSAFFLKGAVKVMRKFKHILLKKPAEGADEIPTHAAPVPHNQKMKLYSTSKAAIVWNCYTAQPGVAAQWMKIPLIKTHPGFSHVTAESLRSGEWPIFPQLKSRTFEAALAGCILLVLHDRFRLIENWFEEGKEFLYWHSETELEDILRNISKDYSRYKRLGINAQQRVISEYNGDVWAKRYLGFLWNETIF